MTEVTVTLGYGFLPFSPYTHTRACVGDNPPKSVTIRNRNRMHAPAGGL